MNEQAAGLASRSRGVLGVPKCALVATAPDAVMVHCALRYQGCRICDRAEPRSVDILRGALTTSAVRRILTGQSKRLP